MLTRIGHHQHDAVGAILDNVWDDELEDVDISLHQVQSAFTLLLASSSSHYNHLRVGSHAIV